jgi:septal ring factor EnvC (AmiA/AmiB activator)
VCKPTLVAITCITILLSGCSRGASESEVAQVKQDAAHAQAQADALKHQQDTQASLAAEVTKLKDDATKAAVAKAVVAKAAAAKSAAKQAAAAKAARVQARMTSCGGNLSAGPSTTCAFASNVENNYYADGGGNSRFDVYSPVTGLYYTMTCIPGVPTVCRGGNNAVVYIR